MTTRLLLSALLALCGTSFASSALAADYFCRVYSGTDTWEKATVNNGHYKITAADPAAAEKAALKKVTGLKAGVTLARARCETTVAAFSATAAEPTAATAPATAPASTASGGDTQYYCIAWSTDNQDRLPPPANAAPGEAEGEYYTVKGGKDLQAQIKVEADALAIAKKYHPAVGSMQCDLSIKSLETW